MKLNQFTHFSKVFIPSVLLSVKRVPMFYVAWFIPTVFLILYYGYNYPGIEFSPSMGNEQPLVPSVVPTPVTPVTPSPDVELNETPLPGFKFNKRRLVSAGFFIASVAVRAFFNAW